MDLKDTADGGRRILVVAVPGMVGLQMGVALQSSMPDSQVTICLAEELTAADQRSDPVSELFSIPTTLWRRDETQVKEWIADSWRHFNNVYLNPSKSSTPECHGIFPLPLYHLSSKPEGNPPPRLLRNAINARKFAPCTSRELGLFCPDGRWMSGTRVMSYVVTLPHQVNWLQKRFLHNGGIVKRCGKLDQIRSELLSPTGQDAIVNCLDVETFESIANGGSGAVEDNVRRVATSGGKTFVVKAKAPWIKLAVVAEDVFVYPTMHHVVLGVTTDETDLELSKEQILEECRWLIPSLAAARLLSNHDVVIRQRPSFVAANACSVNTHLSKPVVHCHAAQETCLVPGMCNDTARLTKTMLCDAKGKL